MIKYQINYQLKMGWGTTNRTKPMMIDKLAEFVREQYLGLHSDMVIGEMYIHH